MADTSLESATWVSEKGDDRDSLRQASQMTRKLGIQLVERSRSKVILTPIGDEIVSRSRRVLRDVQEIVELAKHGQSLLGGTIRLGILHSLGPYLLPHILPELHESYPALKLHVREGLPGGLVQQLEDGRLDLLVFPLPLKNAELEVARLFREPLLVAVARDHPLAAKDCVERADLKGETILALERGHRLL